MSERLISPFERAAKRILANLAGAGREKGVFGEALDREVTLLEEAAERFFRKVEGRLEALERLQESLDAKARALEDRLARAERAVALPHGAAEGRGRAVAALHAKGLSADEIASFLDIPRGEVELMLELRKSHPAAFG